MAPGPGMDNLGGQAGWGARQGTSRTTTIVDRGQFVERPHLAQADDHRPSLAAQPGKDSL